MDTVKYVVLNWDWGNLEMEFMFIFCDLVTHSQFVRKMRMEDKVVSAGFLSVNNQGTVTAYGESVSLDVKSRPEDTQLAEQTLFPKPY